MADRYSAQQNQFTSSPNKKLNSYLDSNSKSNHTPKAYQLRLNQKVINDTVASQEKNITASSATVINDDNDDEEEVESENQDREVID